MVVCHVPAYATNAVAELALGLMLAVTRRIPAADQYLRRTRSSDWQPFQGSELNGKTLGVVGTGVIGQRVARLGHCLGMSLLAYDVQPSQSLIDDFRIRYVPLSELFAKSDVVTSTRRSRPPQRALWIMRCCAGYHDGDHHQHGARRTDCAGRPARSAAQQSDCRRGA